MRTLIIVKRGGEAITNRDISEAEDGGQATYRELKTSFPDGQFIVHTCGEKGCTEKEFEPNNYGKPKVVEPAKPVEQPVAKPKSRKNK